MYHLSAVSSLNGPFVFSIPGENHAYDMDKWQWKLLSCVQLFVTPWNTVYGILQARILEWVAFPFSRGSSQPKYLTQVSHIAGGFFTSSTDDALHMH